MNYDALIVIDMQQTALIEEHPYNEAVVIQNVNFLFLLSSAKTNVEACEG